MQGKVLGTSFQRLLTSPILIMTQGVPQDLTSPVAHTLYILGGTKNPHDFQLFRKALRKKNFDISKNNQTK
jgi:hypothetical protein